MARIERDVVDATDMVCVFIAGTLREAREAESLLTSVGVDYTVDVEPIGTTLFGSSRHGAAFYVATGQAAYSASKLVAAGLSLGVLIKE